MYAKSFDAGLTKVLYSSGPNLVILTSMGDQLLRRKARGWHTHGHIQTQTDAGNNNTRRPKLATGNTKHDHQLNLDQTRMPAFWEYPLLPHD